MKSGYAVIIGRPNVGKSTLLNHIVGQKIAIMSDKPQTTRGRILAVYTDDIGQIVFLDTPGIHKAKSKLGEYMSDVIKKCRSDADVIIWVVEADTYIGTTDKIIADSLLDVHKPIIICINKADMLDRKDAILPIIQSCASILPDAQIIPVSASKGNNIDILIDAIMDKLQEGPLYYDAESVTDMSVRDISSEIIREKALHLLSDEVPHGIAVTIDKMTENKDIAHIDATIICERQSHKAIIIGKDGKMLKKIGMLARHDIEEMTGLHVNLKLWVKISKDWRDDTNVLKMLGYNRKEI